MWLSYCSGSCMLQISSLECPDLMIVWLNQKKKQQIPRPSHEWISTRTRAILLFKKKINYKIELLFFFTTDQPMAGLVSWEARDHAISQSRIVFLLSFGQHFVPFSFTAEGRRRRRAVPPGGRRQDQRRRSRPALLHQSREPWNPFPFQEEISRGSHDWAKKKKESFFFFKWKDLLF